jgi:hypothetical protein
MISLKNTSCRFAWARYLHWGLPPSMVASATLTNSYLAPPHFFQNLEHKILKHLNI